MRDDPDVPHDGTWNRAIDCGDEAIPTPFLGGTADTPSFGAGFTEVDTVIGITSFLEFI